MLSRTSTRSLCSAFGLDNGVGSPRKVRIGVDAGVQVEVHAQIELGNDLSAVGAAHVWQAHGSKQYGISTFALAKRCLGQRDAAVEVVLRPGGQPFKGQRATHARLDSFEHGLCGMHDFGADAVARQYGNAVVLFHASLEFRVGSFRLVEPDEGLG